jgi:carbonic anhydrase
MLEMVWQYDPTQKIAQVKPATFRAARTILEAGNDEFANFLNAASQAQTNVRKVLQVAAADIGLSDVPGQPPQQVPFAAVLSCADARVPVELVFDQHANDLFVVRVAGNIPGTECLGSLHYAVAHMGSIRLLSVIGPTGCGGITAAVDAYLSPSNYMLVATNPTLRSIVDGAIASVRAATDALGGVYGTAVNRHAGYRAALIELSVMLHAAVTASVLEYTFRDAIGERLGVVYGVYNLGNHRVGLPTEHRSADNWNPGLFAPFHEPDGLVTLSRQLAQSPFVEDLLSRN